VGGQLALGCWTFTFGELQPLSTLSCLLNQIINSFLTVFTGVFISVLHFFALLFAQLLLLHENVLLLHQKYLLVLQTLTDLRVLETEAKTGSRLFLLYSRYV
jgi:hypothetical protein